MSQPKRKTRKNKEIEVIATVTLVNINECPPDQAAKMIKVREMFEQWFTEADNEVRTEKE